jgi:hypothetical protein
MKLGHKGHLNIRNKFPKEVFPKSNDSFLIWDELKNLGFGGDEEKSIKSKGLESWIHSKVRGKL